jgi:hypothetical protein
MKEQIISEGKEALERALLLMKYDSKKTLTENKETIFEQLEAPAVVGAAAGAGLGAGAVAASTTTAGASVIVPVMSALGVGATAAGAIVAGAAGLVLLPLVYWIVTKDTGANKVKKMFEMCSSEGAKIAKLPRKMSERDFRDMSDNIEDAINDTTLGFAGGTDEEKLFAQFKRLEDGTASDFCAFVKYYNSHSDSGDLFDDLDSDIDAESEWKQIFRPIRNCVEDSLLTIQDDDAAKDVADKDGKKGGSSSAVNTMGYKLCTGKYVKGCKSPRIKELQNCLGTSYTGKNDIYFGDLTQAALKANGYESGVTDADIDKICQKESPVADSSTDDINEL